MFQPGGPSFLELLQQCFSSTCRGYDLLAPKFDKTPFRTPEEVLTKIASFLQPVTDSLDLCCGTGAGLQMLDPLTQGRLAGLDCSPQMLAVARHAIPRAELIQGDVLTMNFSGAFDLISSFGAFGHIRPHQEARFVRLVWHALRPGGRFVFVTAYSPEPTSARFWRSHLFNAAMHTRNFFWRPPFIMYYLTFLLPYCKGMLEAHGFAVIERPGLFADDLRDLVFVEAIRPF